MNKLYGKAIAQVSAAAVVVMLILTSCSNEGEDISYAMGMTSKGDDEYTVAIQIDDHEWDDLDEDQKVELVEKCTDTVEMSDEDGEYTLVVTDKRTGRKLFRTKGQDGRQETIYFE